MKKKTQKETQLEVLRSIFPVVEIYENYFSKHKSNFTTYVGLKKVAVKDLIALNFFNRQLTLNEVGLILGCTRWNVSILEKSEITEKDRKLFRKCLKYGLYPVKADKPVKGKRKSTKIYKLIDQDEKAN